MKKHQVIAQSRFSFFQGMLQIALAAAYSLEQYFEVESRCMRSRIYGFIQGYRQGFNEAQKSYNELED